jgi:hypothetical protein
MAAAGTGVKRGNGRPASGAAGQPGRPARPSPAFQRLALHRPPPHMRGRGSTPWGSSSSQLPVEFRPYPPSVGGWSRLAARGEFPAPNWPLGPPPVPHARFLGHWEGQKSVECIRYDFLRNGCD